jgi:hypothetical protein
MISSLGRLKTLEQYKNDREYAISNLQQVGKPRVMPVQCDLMDQDIKKAMLDEFTPQNLALHLHQFYCDRLNQLAQLKHNLQTRWARFALRDHKISTQLHSHYQKCIDHVCDEYSTCLNLSRKLSAAVDLHLAKKPIPNSLICEEDVTIYLRWLTHTYSVTRMFMTFISQVDLIPLLNQEQLDAPKYTVASSQYNAQRSYIRNRIRRLSSTISPNISVASMPQLPQRASIGQLSSIPSTVGPTTQEAVPTSSLPLIITNESDIIEHLEQLISIYSLQYSDMKSSSEKLAVFYNVLAHFRSTLQNQVKSLSFLAYDHVPKEKTNKPHHGFRQLFRMTSNWLDEAPFKCLPDDLQLFCYIQMKDSVQDIDPLLRVSSQCTYINNEEKVLYALSQHYQIINSHQQSFKSLAQDQTTLWKCIYSAVDMRNPRNIDEAPTKFAFDDQKKSNLSETRGSIGINEAMSMLDEDEGRKISTNADTLPRDPLFSYILLRHLQIRDARYKCLMIINYFCSVERTLTFNAVSYPQEKDNFKFNMGISPHLFKTPSDYITWESEFMELQNIEARDDYYAFEDLSNVHVWDQNGKLIIYDVAETRLKELENDLLIIGTFFMQKEMMTKQAPPDSENSDISLPKIDRFTVLLDLWTCHAQLLKEKLKLVNLYMEAYHSCYHKREKNKLAQVITDIMGLQLRIDISGDYFTKSYQKEKSCLTAHFEAVQSIMHKMLETERSYNQTCNGYGPRYFGLPPKVPPKVLVNLSGYTATNINHYLLENCNSLSSISLLKGIIRDILLASAGLNGIESTIGIVNLNIQLWNKVKYIWNSLNPLGSDYSTDIQQRFFSSMVLDSPHQVVELLEFQQTQTLANSESLPPHEKQEKIVQSYCDLLQLVHSRHLLVITCEECVPLYQLYNIQSKALEQETYSYLRCIPISPHSPSSASKTLDEFIQIARNPKNESIDNYDPGNIIPAIQEIDNQHIGRFSFNTKESITKILINKSGLTNVMATLQVQVATKHALLIVCQQAAGIIRFTSPLVKERKFTSFSQLLSEAAKNAEFIQLIHLMTSTYISLQKEKTAIRDYVLSQTTLTAKDSQQELERKKCSLVSLYSSSLLLSLSNYSLKTQIIISYYDITKNLLKDYPNTRDAYFISGGIVIPSSAYYAEQNKLTKGRVKAVLSQDGKQLLNLFYLPHASEVALLYHSLPVKQQREVLTLHFRLVSLLLNILGYSCATAKIGRMCDSIGNTTATGKESISGDVHQLQIQLSQLKSPSDPHEVLSYLEFHHDCLILSHDIVVRHYLKRTILNYGDERSYNTMSDVCIPNLNKLLDCNLPQNDIYPLLSYSPIPNSLQLFPHRDFYYKYGVGLIQGYWYIDVVFAIFNSIAPLNSFGRQAASGELLAMSLLLEDVLLNSDLAHHDPKISHFSKLSQSFKLSSSQIYLSKPLTRSHSVISVSSIPPIAAEKFLIHFITISTQLEKLRESWGCSLLGVKSINNQRQVIHLEELFQNRVMQVARRQVARQEAIQAKSLKLQMENESADESLTTLLTETDITWESLEQSDKLNELLLRETILMRLNDLLNQQYLHDEIRHTNHLIQLSIKEQQRDVESLPIDLWKQSSMKDIPGVPQPHMIDDFLSDLLQQNMSKSDYMIEISLEHLNKCISQLRCDVLAREKECYKIYAGFYESSLQSLYHQLYLKNQELETYIHLVQNNTEQSAVEEIVTTAKHTRHLLSEITSLRVTIMQMQQQLKGQKEQLKNEISLEYHQLFDQLEASCIAVKDKYEEYRQRLYSEVVSSLNKIRHNITNQIFSLNESTNIKSIEGVDIQQIQQENVHLSKAITKLRSVYHWKKRQADNKLFKQKILMQQNYDKLQCEYIEMKMRMEEENKSLQQQVAVLQKTILSKEMMTDALRKSLEEEKNKKSVIGGKGSKAKKEQIVTNLDKLHMAKIEELTSELDNKESILISIQSQQEKERETTERERIRKAKV